MKINGKKIPKITFKETNKSFDPKEVERIAEQKFNPENNSSEDKPLKTSSTRISGAKVHRLTTPRRLVKSAVARRH